ncbi:MAG TPA: ABC transporter ATP-binding protein [Marinilabiliales bacterium]|jgi:putative ABC transport system permease protein|nr:ABC transporter permease [Salinivirgaceae bacterium]OFX65473.1 MAG: ABC transporter ATP-binding protein [Bacteroidetes bacterium GWC2_40_13]OFX73336.1 MAG: ABC transporter ATP-binding protein [Bacteroidetes bacterium GWD2_40_43]OFX88656.1 MAG: ABC transporter ATP-binding protein [Bacteroidetes bacterium GWE2_40_63]OFY22696.1 MAG: ABC transporter ATP-binding protein [Bacteroidetes bacterium GWF2_40_13]OFZ24090.1 MAG: ABC transporter ATP-binding protein [Bacteroidetes bacterium RIFOXYC2_FULL_
MFDIDLYKEVWQAISKNKWRSTVTAFGVFWGIFMLVALAGVGNGLENGINKQFEGFATNAAFMWTENTTLPYKGFKKGRNWNLDNDDMIALRTNIPEIEYLVPRLQAWRQSTTNNAVYKDQYGSFQVQGDYPYLIKVEPIKMTKGRFLNEIDIQQNRKVCVIGSRVEEVLFKNGENPVGKYIRVSGVYFQVIGVTSPEGNIQIGYDKKESIHIPFTTVQSAFNYGDIVHFFSFTAKSQFSVADVENRIIEILKKRHDISPDDQSAVGHINIERQFKIMSYLFIGINVLIYLVGLGTLLAGIIGISNIMLVIVKERTQEIGIKRALGATPLNIIRQIVLESIVLTFTAGYAGLILGIALNELLGVALTGTASEVFLNPGIDLSMGIKSLVILVIAGALAGLLPANRAVKVKPIDAIREE